MTNAVELITVGRQNLRIEGKTEEGRKSFHDGLVEAIQLFTAVYEEKDLFMMLLCETLFLAKDLEGARDNEQHAKNSYATAMIEYDDAFNCLEIIKKPEQYQIMERGFSHAKTTFRYQKMPKDGFVVAMLGNPVRLINGLKMVGVDPEEQELIELRAKVCRRALQIYREMQEGILGELE
jgi:hypothetical protein